MNFDWKTSLVKEATFVAFDLETTGKYPLGSEICEMAAVKYRGGQVIDTFQALIKPKVLMSQEVINIHGITNEMVSNSPSIEERIEEFFQFCAGSIMMAHHSPFDMGFLAWEFERAKLELPQLPVMCTSLLSRAVITESPNHRLVTLAKVLNIDPGSSHRALDDAKTCLDVGRACLNRLQASQEQELTLEQVFSKQGGPLWWGDFSILALKKNEVHKNVIQALVEKSEVAITYAGGSNPGKERMIRPVGVVRGPERDFLMAIDTGPRPDPTEKRFYLNRITASRLVGQLSL